MRILPVLLEEAVSLLELVSPLKVVLAVVTLLRVVVAVVSLLGVLVVAMYKIPNAKTLNHCRCGN